jgi:hypothetical protein
MGLIRTRGPKKGKLLLDEWMDRWRWKDRRDGRKEAGREEGK